MSTTAVERCLSVVEALVDESAGVSLVDLAARLDMPNSAIHRTLAILASRGYVRQDPATQAYALTLRLSKLGFRLLGARHLPDAGQPVLQRLAEQTGEYCRLAVVEGGGSHLDRASAGLDAGAALRASDGRRGRAAHDRHRQGVARDAAGRRGVAPRRRARVPVPRRADPQPSAKASCERSTSSAPISRKRGVADTGSPSKKASPGSSRWRRRFARARIRARPSPARSASRVR